MQFYPLMFFLCAILRKIVEIILKSRPYKNNIDFLIPFLIFFSQCLFGYIIYICYSKKTNLNKGTKKNVLSPFKEESFLSTSNKSTFSNDGKIKIIFLILFASFFNFIGTIIRNDDVLNFLSKEEDNSQLNVRVRGIQIIISSLLCHYTIRINIYKHQKLSLIIISFFYAILIGVELYISNQILSKIAVLSICIISNLFRSFLDVTEKYLFEFNYINIFLMMTYEGLTGLFFDIIAILSGNSFKNEGNNLLNSLSKSGLEVFIFIVLIIFYIVISGFKNAYRVTTNKYYSPISRALIESTIDPFLFLYISLTSDKKDEFELFWTHFSIVFFCLMIISLFSLVYNDFIILYCCGLEYNTYSEIINRLYQRKISESGYFTDDNESSSCNSEDKKTISIELDENYIIHM